jgi:two-component system phosphate regulon response regulator PhoB
MAKPISILIVDDEPRIRLALEYNLSKDGFEVITAEDGFQGLELAREKRPDLILLDWMMPEMNGIEVLRKLKERKETKNIPVFMCTAKGTVGDVDRGTSAGADYYITKPFDIWQLGHLLKSKLQKVKKR